MPTITMNTIYGSNRAFDVSTSLSDELVGDVITCPGNISVVSWTIVIPAGVKAKLQSSTFPEDLLTTADTNLDDYWVDWDLGEYETQDVNGFVYGPRTFQGAISVVSGIRIVRETADVDTPVLLGIRGQ